VDAKRNATSGEDCLDKGAVCTDGVVDGGEGADYRERRRRQQVAVGRGQAVEVVAARIGDLLVGQRAVESMGGQAVVSTKKPLYNSASKPASDGGGGGQWDELVAQ